MMGRTHEAFGLMTSAIVMTLADKNMTIGSFVCGSAAAFIASTLPDADNYDARKEQIIVDMAKISFFCYWYEHLTKVKTDSMWLFILIVVLFMSIGCKHRGITHSILWQFVLSAIFYMIVRSDKFTAWFLIGGVSHLIIDTLNEKPIPMFYPIGGNGSCFGLCKADGIVNKYSRYFFIVVYLMAFVWNVAIGLGVK